MVKGMSSKWRIVLFAAGMFLLVGLTFRLLIAPALHSPFISQRNFCTTNDEAYQALQKNYAQWTDYFEVTYPLNSREVMLDDENSQQEYLVRSYYEDGLTKDGKPILFMPTLFPPNDMLGAEGYVYAPSANVPEFGRYNFSKLTENIYCYRLK